MSQPSPSPSIRNPPSATQLPGIKCEIGYGHPGFLLPVVQKSVKGIESFEALSGALQQAANVIGNSGAPNETLSQPIEGIYGFGPLNGELLDSPAAKEMVMTELELTCEPEGNEWVKGSNHFTLAVGTHDTLEKLTLGNFPLSLKLCNITTLTDFKLTDPKFDQPLDTLLEFLESNPSLKRVTLDVKFKNNADHYSERSTPINLEQLEFLSLASDRSEYTKDLLSYIPFPFKVAPTLMSVDYYGESRIGWYEPDGRRVEVHRLPDSEMCFVLTGEFLPTLEGTQRMAPVLTMESLPTFARIEELRLGMSGRSREVKWPPLEPSRFPALRKLIIEGDVQAPTMLSKLILTEPMSELEMLRVKNCSLRKDFEDKFKFALERGYRIIRKQDDDDDIIISSLKDLEYVEAEPYDL